MQWWWGPKENYISFKDIFTFLKIFSCDGALYLESLFWISTGAQLISQSSTGTKCLTVIPFDAVYAACRVCVRDGANWVCIITNCCKGKSMKVKASGSCGTHPWRRQTHTHTLCCHIFKANWMSIILQQQPFFTLNGGKSPSPTKGNESSPVLHALLKRRRSQQWSLQP